MCYVEFFFLPLKFFGKHCKSFIHLGIVSEGVLNNGQTTSIIEISLIKITKVCYIVASRRLVRPSFLF